MLDKKRDLLLFISGRNSVKHLSLSFERKADASERLVMSLKSSHVSTKVLLLFAWDKKVKKSLIVVKDARASLAEDVMS